MQEHTHMHSTETKNTHNHAVAPNSEQNATTFERSTRTQHSNVALERSTRMQHSNAALDAPLHTNQNS
jgi:hypothetical protein